MSERTPSQLVSPFHLVAEELVEKGYRPIPIHYATKKSAIGQYQIYKEHDVTMDQVDRWCELFENTPLNVALVTGNNLIVIDVDCEFMPELAAEILAMAPQTPIRRVGSKGACLLYKPDPTIPMRKKVAPYWGEVLSNGCYMVVPPSIHNKTNQPYRWEGHLVDAADLPILHNDILEAFILKANNAYLAYQTANGNSELAEKLKGTKRQHMGTAPGEQNRNEHLTNVAYALACKGHDAGYIAAELRRVSTHEISSLKGDYFLNEETLAGIDPDAAALTMANRAIKAAENGDDTRLDRQRLIKLPTSYDLTSTDIDEINTNPPTPPPTIYLESLPPIDTLTPMQAEARTLIIYNAKTYDGLNDAFAFMVPAEGLMRYIYDEAVVEHDPSPAIALSSAIALCMALGCNRIRVPKRKGSVYAGGFVMNIAYSGRGKTKAQNAVNEFLALTGDKGIQLIGDASLLSSNAVFESLKDKFLHRKLNCYDEMAKLWTDVERESGALMGADDILNKAYSAIGNRYNGDSAKSKDSKIAAIEQPGINILGSSTPGEMAASLRAKHFKKGSLSRYMIFIDLKQPPPTDFTAYTASWEEVGEQVDLYEFDNGGVIDDADDSDPLFRFQRLPGRIHDIVDRFILQESTPTSTNRFKVQKIPMRPGTVDLLKQNRLAMDCIKNQLTEASRGKGHDSPEAYKLEAFTAYAQRADDHIIKLAMAYVVGMNLFDITPDTLMWALRVFKLQLSCYWTLLEASLEVHGTSAGKAQLSFKQREAQQEASLEMDIEDALIKLDEQKITIVSMSDFIVDNNFRQKHGMAQTLVAEYIEELAKKEALFGGDWAVTMEKAPGKTRSSKCLIRVLS